MGSRKIAAVAVLLVMMLAGAACNGSDGDDDSGADGVGAPAREIGESGGSDAGGGGGVSYDQSSGGETFAAIGDLPPIGPRVIKTADLRIEVANDGTRDAARDVVDLATEHGGFVLSSSIEEEGRSTATIVIRVPAESFERALGDLDSVGDIEQESVSGQDVSEEFIDLEARVRNFEAQETVLLDLMGRSRTVADTIRVQRELQGVQLEIERLHGRLRFLEDQTALSTINVSLVESGPAPSNPGTLERAWDRATDTFFAVASGVVIGAGFVLPIAILALLCWVAWRVLRPRLA